MCTHCQDVHVLFQNLWKACAGLRRHGCHGCHGCHGLVFPKHLTGLSKVGKQKGVELALFSPVDFDERLQGSWILVWVHVGPWWSMMVHDGPWWSMMVHDGPWWCMMVHDGPWLSVHATSHTTALLLLRLCLILAAVWVVWHSFHPGFLCIFVGSWSLEIIRSPYR